MKTKRDSVGFSTRTWVVVSARPLALSLVALSALVLAAPYSLRAQMNGTVNLGGWSVSRVNEAGGYQHYFVSLHWVDLRAAASVTLQVTGGTAREGADFRLDQKVVSASPGQTYNDVVVFAVADSLDEGQETIEVTLTNPTGGVVIGWPDRTTVALADNPDVKSFNLPVGYSIPLVAWKYDGKVRIDVERQGSTTESADVDYRTEPGTAQPGVDYLPVSGTLHFGPAANGANFTVPFLTNSPPRSDKDFRVVLSNPSAGYILGSPKEVTVRILNDEGGFALQPRFGTNNVHNNEYQLPVYQLPENAGEALVDVVILGDTATRPVTVEYRTQPVSATPVQDYTPVSGTLTFAAGESRKTLAIPILNDSYTEDWESFRLRLENPTGGLPLSRPREVEIGISDNDRGYFIADIDWSRTGNLVFDERAGTVTVNVGRVGDYNFPSSVHYRVTTNSANRAPGLATAGADFLPTEGTLTFGANETNKTFALTILDDSLIESDEDFFIVLDQGTGVVPFWPQEVQVIVRDGERNQVRVDPDFKPDWPISLSWPLGVALPAVQPADGKILEVTQADRLTGEDGVLVLRWLPDGRADPAWQTAVISGLVGFLVPQTNGQVLIAAASGSPHFWNADNPNFVVNGVARRHLARLNADGSLDTGFSAQLPTNTVVTGLAVQRNGQILAVVGNPSADSRLLMRLDAAGSLDPAFNPPTLVNSYSRPMVLEAPDGGILVASGQLMRFNPDGSLDTQFQPPSDSWVRAVQPDGRLLVTFYTNDIPYLARLTADGQLDPTFASLATDWRTTQVLPGADGKIWILDRAVSGVFGYRLLRKNADGSDDRTWPVANLRAECNVFGDPLDLLDLPDGNLLLAPRASFGRVNGQPRVGLTRLLVKAPLPRFEVDLPSAMVPENGGKVPITLLRCGTNTEPITVAWQTAGGTARPGVDYLPASGTLTFPTNESVATIELELLDNSLPDEDRTVRLRLQGPPPENQPYPVVELTIANDDLGFLPGGIKRFPNGRVLLRPTGYGVDRASGAASYLEASENLRDWIDPGLGGGYSWIGFSNPEVLDKTAPTNVMRFYRLRKELP